LDIEENPRWSFWFSERIISGDLKRPDICLTGDIIYIFSTLGVSDIKSLCVISSGEA